MYGHHMEYSFSLFSGPTSRIGNLTQLIYTPLYMGSRDRANVSLIIIM